MKTNVFYPMLLGGLAALLFSCTGGGKEKEQNILVDTAVVLPASDEKCKEFSFIAQPFRTSELSFRVGGPIDHFDVYAGNQYKQGSIIAEIDRRDFHIRKERSEAIYQQAQAEYERIKVLYEKNNLSASAYEKAKADYTSAKTAYEMSVNELEDTRLVAPFNGYVGEVYIEKYQDVKATQPILSFIDIDQLKIEIYVTQDIAFRSQSLDSVQLYFDAQPRKLYKAKIIEVSKGTTRNNLSYLLTALLPNKEGRLLAGMSGKAILEVPDSDGIASVLIPQTALSYRPAKGHFAWVVDPTTKQVSSRKVVTGGLTKGGGVKITEGLILGETVVVSGLRFLSDGIIVTIPQKGKR